MSQKKNNKVLVFGVFDFLHAGHISFLRQAKKLSRFLMVSVARDDVVLRFKGHWPVLPEGERLKMIGNSRLADKIILGAQSNKNAIAQILDLNPTVIALGYDQKPYLTKNDKALEKLLGIKVRRLRPHKAKSQKTNHLRFIGGRVQRNLGRGARLGFPTINIPAPKNIPEGIYIARVSAPNLLKNYPALAFVGAAITFGEAEKHLEAYLLDWQGDLGGRKVCVELVRKIRDNKRFKSAGALIKQMKKDEQVARNFFKRYNK